MMSDESSNSFEHQSQFMYFYGVNHDSFTISKYRIPNANASVQEGLTLTHSHFNIFSINIYDIQGNKEVTNFSKKIQKWIR